MSRHRRSKKALGGIGSLLSKAAPYIAFAQQLTAKDMTILPANRSYVQQGKDFINIVTGRMAGFHLFNAASDYKPPFTINPAAILTSKWVQGGAGMIGYQIAAGIINKRVGKTVLPKAGTIGSIGKKIMFGGAIGALFDAPNGQSSDAKLSNYVAPAPVEFHNNSQINYQAPTQSQYVPLAAQSYNSMQQIPIEGGIN